MSDHRAIVRQTLNDFRKIFPESYLSDFDPHRIIRSFVRPVHAKANMECWRRNPTGVAKLGIFLIKNFCMTCGYLSIYSGSHQHMRSYIENPFQLTHGTKELEIPSAGSACVHRDSILDGISFLYS